MWVQTADHPVRQSHHTAKVMGTRKYRRRRTYNKQSRGDDEGEECTRVDSPIVVHTIS